MSDARWAEGAAAEGSAGLGQASPASALVFPRGPRGILAWLGFSA